MWCGFHIGSHNVNRHKQSKERQGKARKGKERQCSSNAQPRQGKARQGKARQGVCIDIYMYDVCKQLHKLHVYIIKGTFLQNNFDQHVYALIIPPYCTGSQWNLVSRKSYRLRYQNVLASYKKWWIAIEGKYVFNQTILWVRSLWNFSHIK